MVTGKEEETDVFLRRRIERAELEEVVRGRKQMCSENLTVSPAGRACAGDPRMFLLASF